ncbi:MAG: YihY/virulence factor BrkB family protein [Candidatus Cloacimonetes bacterium]|nr:YihY/virulence factor BrkB family protein [Candidatus Cloacimonadota bacterium]
MGKKKQETSLRHRLFIMLSAFIRIGIIDAYKVWLSVSVPKRRKKVFNDIYGFLSLLYTRVTKEGILKEAGSLTYITILGFVPFVTFLVLIAPDLPFLNLGEKFREVVAKNFIPGSANAITNFVDELIMRRRVGFNIFNFVVLIVSSYSLFKVIRDTFDRILSMELAVKQDLVTQVVRFFGTIVFGLVIMVVLFSSSSIPLISKLLKISVLRWFMWVIPFFLQFLGLMFLYMLLPSVKTKPSSLVRGTFWTTLIWVMIKSLFDVYIYNLTSMQAIYGVMAALPIFLMWIYINWVIILGGVVLVSIIDNMGKKEIAGTTPKQIVRVTLEMYSNNKLNQRLEGLLNKKELKHLSEVVEEDGDL